MLINLNFYRKGDKLKMSPPSLPLPALGMDGGAHSQDGEAENKYENRPTKQKIYEANASDKLESSWERTI